MWFWAPLNAVWPLDVIRFAVFFMIFRLFFWPLGGGVEPRPPYPEPFSDFRKKKNFRKDVTPEFNPVNLRAAEVSIAF